MSHSTNNEGPRLQPSITDGSLLGGFVRSLRQGPTILGWQTMPKDLRWMVVAFVAFPAILLVIYLLPGGTYSINDRPVSRDEFFDRAWHVLLPMLCIFLVLGYGVWTERLWVRPASILMVVAANMYTIWQNDFTLGIGAWLSIAATVGGTVWFWYFKSEIVNYYDRLRDSSSAGGYAR